MAAKQAKVRQSIRYVMSGGHSAKHISAPVSGLCSICFFTHGLLVGKVWIDIISGCCAVGSAPALGAGGPGFESPHSDQISTGFDKKPVDLFCSFRSGDKENVRNPQKSALQMVKM